MINRKEMLVISVIIFLTIVSWVMFEIYQLQTKPLIQETVTEEFMVPEEKINTKVIDELINRN